MIDAKDARAKANAVRDAAAREKEDKIKAQWAKWGPEVESAIKSACEQGLNSVEVGINVSYAEANALRDMVEKHIESLGYRTEFKWVNIHTYRLYISW